MIWKKPRNTYKKKIIFLTDNIFTKRDYQRYGIFYLNKYFKIKIFTLNKFYLKSKYIYFFNNYSKLKEKIRNEKANYLIDLMFPSFKSFLIKRFCKSKNIKLIKLSLSTYPVEKISYFQKLVNLFNKKKKHGGNILVKLKNRLIIKLNSIIKYDYHFIDSQINRPKNKFCKVIQNHSLDYDIFLLNKEKTKKKLIVFLDSNVISHNDYNIHFTKSPVNKENYIREINEYLAHIEKIFKQKVIVAANPKSKLHEIKKIFRNRKVLINNSFNLIKNAKIVFTHKSTAVSFVTCLNKSIVFLTSNELNESWYGDQIKYQAKLLGSQIINISSAKKEPFLNIIKINKRKYKKYIYNYIKIPKTKNKYNWEIFKEQLV
jgi:hypothetical protein